MTPTVPEFKAFKGFADISQSLEAIDKVPPAPPGEKKRENAQIRKSGKWRKNGENCQNQAAGRLAGQKSLFMFSKLVSSVRA